MCRWVSDQERYSGQSSMDKERYGDHSSLAFREREPRDTGASVYSYVASSYGSCYHSKTSNGRRSGSIYEGQGQGQG